MTTAASSGTARTSTRKAPAGNTTTGAEPAGESRQKSLQQHLVTVAEPNVMDPQGLYEFCESLRALATGLAFFTHAAGTQLDRAARKGAQDAADGRLTLTQKTQLRLVLRRVSKQLNADAADALLDAARAVVKAYGTLGSFLDEVESSSVDRPHRSSQGGFNLFRS